MLHQPITHFDQPTPPPALDVEGRPIFDAAAYVVAMRADGVSLHPMRGKPGSGELDGTFVVVATDSTMGVGVQGAFAARWAADPRSEGRVAQFLFNEAATARFAAAAQDDLVAALAELTRLRAEEEQACQREVDCRCLCNGDEGDPAYRDAMRAADLTGEAFQNGFRYVLAIAIRSTADAGLKAIFALQHCDMGEERRQVLAEIAAFHVPELAGALHDHSVLAA